jgi:hypothetical protein
MLEITKFTGELACAVAVMNLAPAIGDETSTRIGPLELNAQGLPSQAFRAANIAGVGGLD